MSRRRRNTSKAHSRKSDSESDEGTWLDTASDSDDRSSYSELDVRASQRKSYRRNRVADNRRRPTEHERAKRGRSRSNSPIPDCHSTDGKKRFPKNTEVSKEQDRRSRSSVGRSRARSPIRNSTIKDKRSNKTEAPWRADFEKWSRKKATKRPKAYRRDRDDRSENGTGRAVGRDKENICPH